MPASHEREKEPLHPAVLSALLAESERDRSGHLGHALDRSPDRHRALIRLVVGALLVAALVALWHWVS